MSKQTQPKEEELKDFFELEEEYSTPSAKAEDEVTDEPEDKPDFEVEEIDPDTVDPLEDIVEPEPEDTDEPDAVVDPVDPEEDDFGAMGELMKELVGGGVLTHDEEKEYDASQEGINELISDNVEKKSIAKLEEYKESLGDDAKEFLDFAAQGGSFADFQSIKEEIDYSAVPLERDGEPMTNNQGRIIADYMEKVRGLKGDEIDDFVALYEEKGTLAKNAEKAKAGLVEWQAESKVEMAASRKKLEDDAVALELQQATDFKEDLLARREISGFKISKKEAADLHEFITKPLSKGGETAFAAKDNEESRLLYALLAKNNFNKDTLAKEMKRDATINLKKKLSNYTDSNTKVARAGAGNTREESKTLKIDFMI